VYAKLNGKIVKQEVIEGLSNEVNAEIKAGLNEADIVYLSAPPDPDKIVINRLPKNIKEKFKKPSGNIPNTPITTTSKSASASNSGIN
jgi:hypothetical protein